MVPATRLSAPSRNSETWRGEFTLVAAELKARVEAIQDCTFRLRNLAMDALVEFIGDIKTAKTAGKAEEQLASARDFQRKAQFYLDFIEAENSMGFHAPQEAARILGESIDFTRRGQRELQKRSGEKL